MKSLCQQRLKKHVGGRDKIKINKIKLGIRRKIRAPKPACCLAKTATRKLKTTIIKKYNEKKNNQSDSHFIFMYNLYPGSNKQIESFFVTENFCCARYYGQ